jgi:hypothetical protein
MELKLLRMEGGRQQGWTVAILKRVKGSFQHRGPVPKHTFFQGEGTFYFHIRIRIY